MSPSATESLHESPASLQAPLRSSDFWLNPRAALGDFWGADARGWMTHAPLRGVSLVTGQPGALLRGTATSQGSRGMNRGGGSKRFKLRLTSGNKMS